jgi:AcrR family transcriptional regulator
MQGAPDISTAAGPPRRRGEVTAERILDAAEELFAERGYVGATLRDVAAQVGLRNPSLYNHFPNKESLYAAVLERGIGPVLAALSKFVEAGEETYQDSSQVVARIMELLAQRPNLPRLILHETLSGGQRLTPMLRDWIAPTFARAHQMAEATSSGKRWEPDQIPLLVLAIYHMVLGYFTTAPFYKELNGEDLMSSSALARQTHFLGQVVEALLGDGTCRGKSPAA